MDLSLVPLEELIKEAESRCVSFVAAMKLEGKDEEGQELKFQHGKGDWSTAVGLSGILYNYCVNNWNGELKTLQKINDEEKEANDG